MEKRRCFSCMEETPWTVCQHCGYPAQGHNAIHQLPIGTLLRNRYRIGRVLGQGGFGITYMAWDLQKEQIVAVKEFFPGSIVYRRSSVSTAVECTTREAVPCFLSGKKRFLREAEALAKFRDIPQIVDILDFLEANDTAYIIMEYIRGRDLRTYIQEKGGRLTPEETFRILKPVMEALAKVHRENIIHRDIAPDNIILADSGEVKLLDFGAVRTVTDPSLSHGLTSSTEAILKHGFAPLEQYNTRGSLGPWTDEYAMCATVWYCLTGTVPPEASQRMIEETGPNWSSVTGLTQAQRKALEKGFSPNPKHRFRDMDEFLPALFGPEPKVSTGGYKILHQGTMDNGMVEIHYVDENGQVMHVYGHSGKGPKQGLLSRLGLDRLGKKQKRKSSLKWHPPKDKKAAKEEKTVEKEKEEEPSVLLTDFPDYPPTGKMITPREPQTIRPTHQAVVAGLNTGTRRYAMDFSVFPRTVLHNPLWEKKLLQQDGRRAAEIFGTLFPDCRPEDFRGEDRKGLTLVRLPIDSEGSDIWCRAYVLRGEDLRSFRFFTLEQTPKGILVGLVDQDLRHYHLMDAEDNLEETLDLIRSLQVP